MWIDTSVPVGPRRSNRTQSRPVPAWIAVSVALLGLSGYFKGLPLVRLLPIDLTVLSAALVWAGAFVWFASGRRPPRTIWIVLAVWATFLPAALLADSSDAATHKVDQLMTVTLLSAAAPVLLDLRGIRIFLGCHVAAGVAMSWLLWSQRGSAVAIASQRLATDEVATISSGRILGGAVLILVIAAASRHGWLPLLAPAILGGTALLFMVGSRGPAISLILAIVIVAITTRTTSAGARIGAAAVLIGGGVLAWSYASGLQDGGVKRVLDFATGTSADSGREYLFASAWDAFTANPVGLGWAGFRTRPGVMAFGDGTYVYPHNLMLEIGVEAGLIALIAVVGWAGYALVTLHRATDSLLGRGCYTFALFWLLVAQTSSDINGNRLTWMALGLALAAANLERERACDHRESSLTNSKSAKPSMRLSRKTRRVIDM